MKTYQTTKGSVWNHPLTPQQWRGVRKAAKSRFDGSVALFDAAWRKYQREILPGTDNPGDLADVLCWLDSIAAEWVNDSTSRFYIHG